MAEGPKLLDADTLIDEILAKKGPHVYQDGLSEENWEEVSRAGGGAHLCDMSHVAWCRNWSKSHSS